MSDTALLALMNLGAQIAIFAITGVIAALLARQLAKQMKLRSEAALVEDTEKPLPTFPAFSVLFKVVLIIVLLMAGFAANVWLPKNDVSAPAVNSTMQGQIYRDAETKPAVTPAVVPSHEKNDAHRAERIEDIRKQFDALPDDK